MVASHDRPGWLARCLASLRQLDYPAFEIVVAADSGSLDRLGHHPTWRFLKAIAVDEANVSKARNEGLLNSGGDIVAYLDDDAVAEPFWLRHYASAFQTLPIDAAVGFVRGRNGISYQSAVTSVDSEGETHREPAGDGRSFIPKLRSGRALKLVGTNFAVRRSVALECGGFDTAYRYYHDDTDFSLRLAQAGGVSAAVPLAQVHHAFAASPRRTSLRAPRDLTDIGRSSAIFAHRYKGAPPDELKERLFERERARLIRHLVRGTCEPGDIASVMESLASGWREGAVLSPVPPAPLAAMPKPFKPVPQSKGAHVVLKTRSFRRKNTMKEATRLVALGRRVTVISLSLTLLRHHVRYVLPGMWLQTGGQFGRSVRSRARYRWCRFANRVEEEIRRVALARGIGDIGVSFDTPINGVRKTVLAQNGHDEARHTVSEGGRDDSDAQSDQGSLPCRRSRDPFPSRNEGRSERDHDAGRSAADPIRD